MNWTDLTKRFKFSKDPIIFETLNNLDPIYEVNLPESYQDYLKHFGAGFLGGFYHFHSPADMNTHRERLAPFEDTELDQILKENDSGEVLIFATSENGDMLGWRLSEFNNPDEPRILKIPARSFEVVELASNVKELIEKMTVTPYDFWMKFSMTHQPKP